MIIPFEILRAIDSLLLVGLVTEKQAAVQNLALDLQSKKKRGRERDHISCILCKDFENSACISCVIF